MIDDAALRAACVAWVARGGKIVPAGMATERGGEMCRCPLGAANLLGPAFPDGTSLTSDAEIAFAQGFEGESAGLLESYDHPNEHMLGRYFRAGAIAGLALTGEPA